MTNLEAFLKHGLGTDGPFCDEQVAIKTTDTPRNRSVSGYGSKLPTQYMVNWRNKWRRVYAICYSNASTLYIAHKNTKIVLNIY